MLLAIIYGEMVTMKNRSHRKKYSSHFVICLMSQTQVVPAPNLFLSDSFTPESLGQYNVFYKYDDDVIFHRTLDVGANPISDFGLRSASRVIQTPFPNSFLFVSICF